jgi:uncharacterized protein YdeI (YjbR/CyaY-like superfamily)
MPKLSEKPVGNRVQERAAAPKLMRRAERLRPDADRQAQRRAPTDPARRAPDPRRVRAAAQDAAVRAHDPVPARGSAKDDQLPNSNSQLPTPDVRPIFFRSPAELRKWFDRHHTTASELIVGYHRKSTGKPSITWPESVAEALCFGWIDGIRRSLDDESYTIRFTPRRPGSSWSAVNVRMMKELEAAGRMTAAGRAVFDARKDKNAAGYTYERRDASFDAARVKAFKKDKAAWAFFEAQPPGYRRTVTWWVMSAKAEDTRDRRLAKLIASSAAKKRVV